MAREDHVPTAVGLAQGDEGDQVERLQTHLAKFGDLHTPPEEDAYAPLRAASRAPEARQATFDDATLVGLRRYQKFFRLPVTGVLDEATVSLMSRPRCGFPDLPRGGGVSVNGGSATGGAVSSFTAQGNRWTTNNLTYGFQNFSPDLTQQQIRNALAAAFNLWSQVTPLTFQEVALANNPHIIIRFAAGDHGDGAANAFDGPSGTLAHAFYPPPNGGAIAGDAHFDEAETWTVTFRSRQEA